MGSNPLQYIRLLLQSDQIEECLSYLFELMEQMIEAEKKEMEDPVTAKLRLLEENYIDFTVFAATVARAKRAFLMGTMVYESHSAERNRIIQGILGSLKFLDPQRSLDLEPEKFPVVISDAKTLLREFSALSENLGENPVEL